MKIKRLVIENFKSIKRIELIEPNPFTVFVGPNGSGKSNIFEALEFVNLSYKLNSALALSVFGGLEKIKRRQAKSSKFNFECDLNEFIIFYDEETKTVGVKYGNPETVLWTDEIKRKMFKYDSIFRQFITDFTRLFVGNGDLVKLQLNDDQQLSLSAKNLEPVLKRILTNDVLRAEVFEWLVLFIPGFKSVEIDDRNELHWFEQYNAEYFTRDLISDGTYNILALLTAVYQSEEPQFLCIEEPENGLHPQVVMSLVDFFRQQCEEKGHYIWLNTHSESLVRKLRPEEIILVDKREGATQTNQVGKRNFYDLQMDEAWLTGALGGGLPW